MVVVQGSHYELFGPDGALQSTASHVPAKNQVQFAKQETPTHVAKSTLHGGYSFKAFTDRLPGDQSRRLRISNLSNQESTNSNHRFRLKDHKAAQLPNQPAFTPELNTDNHHRKLRETLRNRQNALVRLSQGRSSAKGKGEDYHEAAQH